MDWDLELDAEGLKCPLPVLRLQQGLRTLAPGQVLRLLATDPMAAIDVPHFCAEHGHGFLGADTGGPCPAYLVRKGA
ncbi:tRNA 5-methylaminomethyl-2-thiouridine synthase TusA [Roseibacterium elongatum DSM 19469]|uniref:tRNA 5-methylaminomethyl-2-thiouridine synthase TusA n=1 Tax=Roseicyclus elongatus DSM 19469 TaxID=1294273 RepID=W8RV14_9RHOB|nr:sulfurtransferase TusA family protein [Roseibacterium elongatum]AHM05044.1 tRNA 5-methylaminomethyl-2-thiouridine synthase TusA [Roseibacterium elongatum DSM 19469]